MTRTLADNSCGINHQRIISFDILRIVAIFAVVWLHVSGQRWQISFPSNEWEVRNVYDSMVRWSVPVFVMISGALFLDSNKTLSIKKLYSKNILRIICAFVFWSIIYMFYEMTKTNQQNFSINWMVGKIIKGHTHLWFLKMLLGLYIMTPILKIIANNKKVEMYFLVIALITTFVIPWLFKLCGLLYPSFTHLIDTFYKIMGVNIATGFTGYFMLGHYLRNKNLNFTIRHTIYICGIISCICVIILNRLISFHHNYADTFFYNNLSIFTLAESIAVFTFINHRFKNINFRYTAFIKKVSNLTFGIYLVHILILKMIKDLFNIDSSTIGVMLGIPLLSITVFILSLSVSWLINKIPGANKFIL